MRCKRRWALLFGALLSLGGCHREQASKSDASAPGDGYLVRAKALGGAPLEFGVLGGRVVAAAELPRQSPVMELGQRFVVPAFIDSHVHLSYYPIAESLPASGIVAAVDFAAPLASLGQSVTLPLRRSGPMLTPPGGYPTQSWGADGYGLEVGSAGEASAAVDRLLDAGADFIKAPLFGEQGLSDEALAAVTQRAHERGVRVAVHALGADDALRAIRSQIDILAHTPTEALSEQALAAFGERTLVSTLAAFGGDAALANLRGLREHGARILYGTDLGNTRELGVQAREIEGLMAAGLDGAAIVRAGSADPAQFWGLSELGALEPGKRASFLVLDQDPADNPLVLSTPHAVVVDGQLLTGSLR
ncbi:MAG: amidohydrolase family protein [Polyangiaceae bacterium]